ncbi:hypothetical protein EVJ58_g9138 [Rhodofomes roseus]|uniref:START domain-containing protein n=1 Tax=Rhodofomes roseus TaxID=34475 RepID=A0A4Y9XX61_9APHY|nr:hypothetical protein EVJ58_g9138 [Rhodofomes roseus]
MLDGTRLRNSWYASLDDAQSNFRQLLSSHTSPDWKRVPIPNDTISKGKSRAVAPELTDVVLHRKTSKSSEPVYRAILDVPVGDTLVSLETWKAVLSTPELRKEWDPAVEGAHMIEILDQATRISKVDFTLGWPANPRDAVVISRSFSDATTLIDISTSLPRSPDEPAYLRPSPPYVRSDVSLFAWCVQVIEQPPTSKRSPKLRITCFWQHNLKTLWSFNTASSFAQQLCTMMVGIYNTVQKRGLRIPQLMGYGNGVSIERLRFDLDREALTVDYSIVPEDEDHTPHTTAQGLDELFAIREHKRLTRSVECALPTPVGWDVQIATKASSDQVAQLPWTVQAKRDPSPAQGSTATSPETDRIIFGIKHAALPNDHSVLKVRVVIELSGSSSGIRLNGIPQPIEQVEERDPQSHIASQQMLRDASSAADFSFNTQSSSVSTVAESASKASAALPERPALSRTQTERTATAEKSILSRVKRNYIYFSSLLQEPEAKWKRTTETRGVSIAQLDSIDPTLVVYRAEATFVGLGLWDLYAAVVTPGARAFWDRLYDDSTLLEHVNELTELWHFKTKPAWPVTGRDAVVLKTVYKSPTTIHVFAFSADDPNLFPNIPSADPNVIRTQIDLQGWAIEALSPTTTQLTILEQSDPKGWSNKASIPQQMIQAIAGVGEFAIKCGGPPIVTRLEGAKATQMRYDHDSWANSLDIVVDPPPQTISCLRRHRLSSGGGGLWLTITHDAVYTGDDRLQVIVRRGPMGVPKEKGLVMVNGAKVDVDVEELPDKEVKSLQKQKRIKPTRVPLDQPPVLSLIRRRRAEWSGDGDLEGTETGSYKPATPDATTATQQAAAAIAPAMAAGGDAPSASKPPMQYALEALSYLQSIHVSPQRDGWTLVSEKDVPVYRRIDAEISPVIPVHKGEKVIEGVSAEEVASVLTSYDCRKQWDTRFDTAHVLEVFGGELHTEFVVMKGGFPFRDRGFYLASLMARGSASPSLSRRNTATGETENSTESRAAIYCVSASFSPESVASFSPAKYNSYGLPVGRIYVDGWILETLDPYGAENYAIPSTRCTRVVAVDYSGSIPAAMNSMINGMLPKSIQAVESYVKNISPPPSTRLPPVGIALAQTSQDPLRYKAWKLRRRDQTRLLIASRFKPSDRLYQSTILLNSSDALARPSSRADEKTPRPRNRALKAQTISAATGAAVADELERQSRSRTNSSATSSSKPASMSPEHGRSRSREAVRSSTILTSRGEMRHPTDLLVAELIVDSKLYPGGYEVRIASRIDKSKTRISLTSPLGTASSSTSAQELPFACATYTLPPSPLHSAGLNTDRPPRHLLRLTLPTAQYYVSTIQDPLTGETRSAPPKPQWLSDMEEGRVVLDIEIKPVAGGRSNKKGTVTVNGVTVPVLGEKESLTSLGRDEILDTRASKMDLLSGSSAEDDQLPGELQMPIAVATDLLDDAVLASEPAPVSEQVETESTNATPEANPDAEVFVRQAPQVVVSPPETPAADSTTSGLLRFLNAYPNPLLRFTAPGWRSSEPTTPAPPESAGTPGDVYRG